VRRSDLVELILAALVSGDVVSARTSSGLFNDLLQETITNREQNKENVNSFFIEL